MIGVTPDVIANSVVMAQQAYHASVIVRAQQRAGKNPRLYGHIFEILFQDKQNLLAIVSGKDERYRLTRSSFSQGADIVAINKKTGKIEKRLQLKDIYSNAASSHTARQIAHEGKYRNARLVATTESAPVLNKYLSRTSSSKRAMNSGISGKKTRALAAQAGVGSSKQVLRAVTHSAKVGGLVGAAVGMTVSSVDAAVGYTKGELEGTVALRKVANGAAKSAVVGGASAGAAVVTGYFVTKAAAVVGLGATTITVAAVVIPLAVSVGVGYTASLIYEWAVVE